MLLLLMLDVGMFFCERFDVDLSFLCENSVAAESLTQTTPKNG
jgi:hypothetical protein